MSKKLEYQGKFYALTELARIHDKKACTIFSRMRRGLSLEEALTNPVRRSSQPVEHKGIKYESKVALARALGCGEKRFYRIGKEYATLEDAIPKRNKQSS